MGTERKNRITKYDRVELTLPLGYKDKLKEISVQLLESVSMNISQGWSVQTLTKTTSMMTWCLC